MPLFSVVIPSYNRADLLSQALGSVFTQEFGDFEIIVVDDGSTDDTPAVVAALGDRVRYLRQSNCGPGAARNRGVEAAQGDYVAFLDSDDLWFPWTLRCYADAINQHNSPAILLGKTLRFQQPSELSSVAHCMRLKVRAFDDFLTAAQMPIFWGSNAAAVRREVFAQSGRFREELRVFEDQDLGLRLGTEPRFVKVDGPATVAYRVTPGSLTKDLDKTLAGVLFLLQQEEAGSYPGGKARRWERRQYIAYSVRSVSFGLLHNLRTGDALQLYWRTLRWHVALRRFRYVLGFPLLCATRCCVRSAANIPMRAVTHH